MTATAAHFLGALKAYAALVFLTLTTVAAELDVVPLWLKIGVALAGAYATYKIPNFDVIEDESDPENPVIVELDERDGNLNH